MNGEKVRTLFEMQRQAFRCHPYPSLPERRADLKRLLQVIKENREKIKEAISADFGHRSSDETDLLEIFPSLEAIYNALTHLKEWMRPEKRKSSKWFFPGKSRVIKQPLGVIGIIVPWNYPLYLTINPLVSALAAGNRVMIKMSELVPRFGKLFENLIADTFQKDHIVIINGGPDIGKAVAALPLDHLFFTGSTSVGRLVLKEASQNLIPVTLELGGKSPAIIGPDYPLEKAVSRILIGKSWSGGQTCIAPDYVLLPENQVDCFIRLSKKEISDRYSTIENNRDYTAIIDHNHYLRLKDYLQEARERGAKIIDLNPEDQPIDPATRKISPTLVIGAEGSMKIMQEEIFGPLLPVIPYRTFEEAIRFVNARPRPLALYFFDQNLERINRILYETGSGGVTINDTIFHIAQEELPYGGVGESGMGHVHGREGFETFSNKKGVFFQSRFSLVPLLRPPYGKFFRALLRFVLR